MVTTQLGGPWFDSALEAEATIVADSDGFSLWLELRWDGGRDARTVRALDCDTLARVTALLVALAVDPASTVRQTTDEGEVPPDIGSAQPPTDSVPRDSLPTSGRRSSAPQSLSVVGQGGAEWGAVPGVTAAVALAIAADWRRVHVALGAVALTPRTERTSIGSVQVTTAAVTARACARMLPPRVEIQLCGGVEAGVQYGVGRGSANARRAVGPWVAPTIGVGVRVPLGDRWFVSTGVEGAVPIARPRYELSDPVEPRAIFVPAAVSGRVLLGLGVKIWR